MTEMLSVVQKLHQITVAAKGMRSKTIVTTLDSLVVLLTPASGIPAVERIIDTLLLFTEEADCHPALAQHAQLELALAAVIEDESIPTTVQQKAQRVLDTLNPRQSSPPPASAPLAEMQTPAHSFFKGKVNKMARTLLLQIDGLNDLNARQLLEQHLLRVKGVVSFTFDMKTGRVTVRVRDWLKIENLCEAVAKTHTMTAQQVVRDDSGQEVMLSFGQSPSKFHKENAPAPAYLDEEEVHDAEADSKAVARVGGDKAAGGWFSGLSGMFVFWAVL